MIFLQFAPADEVGGNNKGKGGKKEMSNDKVYLPSACYTLFKEEKRTFCESLYGIKVPSETHPT